MDQRRIALLLAYDGSRFNGWQVQDDQPTVQGELEKALAVLHKEPARITGSGRTDTGVHGLGQVAHFDTQSSIPAAKYREALNSILPQSIRIKAAVTADSEFHSRFDAREREYEYRILAGTRPEPFQYGYYHSLSYVPDVQSLNRIASSLIGEHDFTTFSAAGDKSDSKVRRMIAAHFYLRKNVLIFVIRGNAFLWRMVRSLVGTIIEDERNGGTEYFRHRLLSADRTFAGATAPPGGLYLRRVTYGKRIF